MLTAASEWRSLTIDQSLTIRAGYGAASAPGKAGENPALSRNCEGFLPESENPPATAHLREKGTGIRMIRTD